MIFNEGTYISGSYNNESVEGYVIFNEAGEPFITGKKCLLSEMSNIRITEAKEVFLTEGALDDIVNNDFNKLDKKKVMKMKDKEAEKVGAAREKELKKAGVKLQNDEYKNRFIAAQKAIAAVGMLASDLGDSKTLKKYVKESSNLSEEQLYGDTIPATVTTSLTGKEVPINYELDDADWSNFRLSNQQAADTLGYTDRTLQKIENPTIDASDEIDYSDLLDSKDVDIPNNDDSYNIIDENPEDTMADIMYDEDDVADSAGNIDSFDFSKEDVHIDIKNPNNEPIIIQVGNSEQVNRAQKESEVSEEIENDIDDYKGDINSDEFVESLLTKYNISKEISDTWNLKESSIYDTINKIIVEVSRNR